MGEGEPCRILAEEVKVQTCPSDNSDEWTTVGTGALLAIHLENEPARLILLNNLPQLVIDQVHAEQDKQVATLREAQQAHAVAMGLEPSAPEVSMSKPLEGDSAISLDDKPSPIRDSCGMEETQDSLPQWEATQSSREADDASNGPVVSGPQDEPSSKSNEDLSQLHSVDLSTFRFHSAADGVLYLKSGDLFVAYSFKDNQAFEETAELFRHLIQAGVAQETEEEPTVPESEEGTFSPSAEHLEFFRLTEAKPTNLGEHIANLKSLEDAFFAVYQQGVRARARTSSDIPLAGSRSLVNSLMKPSWLNSFWEVVKEAISTNDESTALKASELLIRLINLGCRLRATQTILVEQMGPFMSWVFDIENETLDDKVLNPVPIIGPPLHLRPEYLNEDWAAVSNNGEQSGLMTWMYNYLDPMCILMSNSHFGNCLRTLERLPQQQSQHVVIPHVQFWQNQVTFTGQEILTECMSSEPERRLFSATLAWVARLSYIRDVALPRVLDDCAINRITVMITSLNVFLCRILKSDRNCITRMQQSLPSSVNVCHFLLQMLRGVKTIGFNLPERGPGGVHTIVNAMTLLGLEGYLTGECDGARLWEEHHTELEALRKSRNVSFGLFKSANHFEALRPVTLAAEIFHICSNICPRHIHQAFLMSSESSQSRSPTLWLALTRVFQQEDDHAVLVQIAETYKNFLKPDVFANDMEQADVLEMFFDKGILDTMIDILLEPLPNGHEAEARLFAKSQILSILCHCSRLKQSSRMNYRFVHSHLKHRLVTIILSVHKRARRKPLGQGFKSLLLNATKFIKIFAVDQEPNVRYGTPRDPVSSLVVMLGPTDLNALADQATRSDSDSDTEMEPTEIAGTSSDEASMSVLEDRSIPRKPRKRVWVSTSDNTVESPSSTSSDGMSAIVFERRRHQGSALEAALLDLFGAILRNHEEKKLLLRQLVERNLAAFTELNEFYTKYCGVDTFGKLLQKAQVDAPSHALVQASGSQQAPHKLATRDSRGAKSLPSQGGMGLLKRKLSVLSVEGNAEPGRGRYQSSPSSGPSSPEPGPLNTSPTKKVKVDTSPFRTSLTRLGSTPAASGIPEFCLPSLLKPVDEPEDALEALVRRNDRKIEKPHLSTSPVTQISTPPSSIRILLHQHLDPQTTPPSQTATESNNMCPD